MFNGKDEHYYMDDFSIKGLLPAEEKERYANFEEVLTNSRKKQCYLFFVKSQILEILK